MIDQRLSRPATGARRPRTVAALAVVLLSLVGCSVEGPSGTDSVVAIEAAQAQAAEEVAAAQEAIDRQVEAADALNAAALAAAGGQSQEAAAADAAARAAAEKAAAEKDAAEKAAAARAAAERAAAPKVAAPKAAAQKAAPRKAAVGAAATKGTPPPPPRTPASGKKAPPRAAGAPKALTPPARPPVVTRPPRPAAVPKPTRPTSGPAAAQPAAVTTDDLHVVVATDGAVTVSGDASVGADCRAQDFQAGDRLRLVTTSGATLHEAVLPACQRVVIPAPGTGVAVSTPSFSVTLPKIAWRPDEAWVLEIGTHRWPVTASTLELHGWSIAVTPKDGITAGPPAPK